MKWPIIAALAILVVSGVAVFPEVGGRVAAAVVVVALTAILAFAGIVIGRAAFGVIRR